MFWGKEPHDGPDVMLAYGGGGATKRDSWLMHMYMCSPRPRTDYSQNPPVTVYDPSMLDELKARGYDITTLDFSIKKLPPSNQEQSNG